jgi:hypothetical protein
MYVFLSCDTTSPWWAFLSADVQKLLRPALTRATLGNDKDCVELLVTLNTPNYRTVIVEGGLPLALIIC